MADSDMPKIDVVMPTWNSYGWWFPRVLNSILQNCNVCHLIVVDRYSQDETLSTVKSLIPEDKVKIIQSASNLALARQIGISNVDTELFGFVDSDIELCPNWFEKLYPFVLPDDVGAAQAAESDEYEARVLENKIEQLIPPTKVTFRAVIRNGLFNLIRGLTTQTLLKTSLIRDWRPGNTVSSFEDFSITQYIISKGYKWLRVNGVVSRHHKYPNAGQKKLELIHKWYLWNGAGARVSGATTLPLLFINVFARFVGAILRYHRRKISLEQFLLVVAMQFSTVQGFIMFNHYLISHRQDAHVSCDETRPRKSND